MLSSQTRAKAALLALCATAGLVCCTAVRAAEEPSHPAALDDAIIAAAKRHGVPEHLVRRIIMRESKYNARARNHKYWGLMQISYPTARSMGFKGTPSQLLDPVVNLRYAVPYLANAFVIAGKSEDAAVRLYAAGYYFTARSRGLINALRTAESTPLSGVADEPSAQPILAANASAQPAESIGVFGALFSPGRDAPPQPQVVASGDAAALPVQPQATPGEASKAPAGTFNGPNVAMVVGKSGDASPPKKWKRDGGITLIARGEQGLEQVAARDAQGTAEPGRKSRRHAHKITLVASLDAPPSSAQAYAAAAGQDPRFAATASQAAIAQATTGQPVATPQVDAFGRPVGGPSTAAPQPGGPQADLPTTVTPTIAENDKPRRRSRHVRHRKGKADTQVADGKAATEAAPPLRTTATQ